MDDTETIYIAGSFLAVLLIFAICILTAICRNSDILNDEEQLLPPT